MTDITIGDDAGTSAYTRYNQQYNGTFTRTYICTPHFANADGVLTDVEFVPERNTFDASTFKVRIFSVNDLGDGHYNFATRSTSESFTLPQRGEGNTTATIVTGLSLSVRKGDAIGIVITATNTHAYLENYALYLDAEDGAVLFDVDGDFTAGTPDSYRYIGFSLKVSGAGDPYPVAGGVGGAPMNNCHSVSETVQEDESTTGLWGVVQPRSFGSSGGYDAAYVDLTFPWDTEGTCTEDEIFQDGVTKSYTNDDNPLEKYSLRMDVTRFTGDEIEMDGKTLDYPFRVVDGGAWTPTTVGNFNAGGFSATWYTVGTRSASLSSINDEQINDNDYGEISQDILIRCSGTTIKFDYNVRNSESNAVFKVLIDNTTVASYSTSSNGEHLDTTITLNYEGVHTLRFRLEATGSFTDQVLVCIDNIRVETGYATGACSNFYECWYIATDDRYVKKDGSDSKLGISWDTAYASYQKGKDNVGTNGRLHVRAGAYTTTDADVFPGKSCLVKPYVDETQSPSNQIIITKV